MLLVQLFLAQYKKLFYIFLLVLASNVIANETEEDKLQLSGFATLGAVYSDSDHHGYRKSVGSDGGTYSGGIDLKQHTLLGLQANWSILPKFDAVYQTVLRDLPDPSLDRYTTLAFLRYEMNANWSVRVGRTAPDIFLLTEYRDVDFSYLWASAPNEVYGIIPHRSIDGIDVTYSQRGFGGVFKTKLFTGSSETELSGSDLLGNTVVEKSEIEDVVGISLSFDHFNWVVQLKHSQVTIANESTSKTILVDNIDQVPNFLWPNSHEFAQSLLLKGKNVSYYSVSGQYQWNNWLASTELSRIHSNSDAIAKITSGYAALSYQIKAHQFYSIYASTDSNPYVFDEPGVNEVALGELIHGTTAVMNFYSANQHTTSLGWRWDITTDIASSFQWNHTSVEETGSVLWLSKPDEHQSAEKINTFIFTLSMVF